MQCEEFLTKHIKTLADYKKMSLKDFKQLKMLDSKTQKVRNLLEFEYVDVYCNLRNPLASPDTDEYITCKDESIYFTNIVFNSSEKVQFSECNEKRLIFTNCIFLTTIVMHDSPKYIEFNSCCLNSIKITTDYRNISFYFSLIGKLNIEPGLDLQIDFDANSNEIGSFYCSNTNAVKFQFYENVIHKVALMNVIKLDNLDYEQIKLFKGELNNLKQEQILDTIDSKYPDVILYTLNFFKHLDGLKECATLCNSIELLKYPYIKRSKKEKVILFFCGYFMKPKHMVIEALITIVVFIIPFMIKRSFSTFSNLLIDSLEKSLTFFLCIGDVSRLNVIHRFIGYLESIIGFFELTVFTISLGKKYLK